MERERERERATVGRPENGSKVMITAMPRGGCVQLHRFLLPWKCISAWLLQPFQRMEGWLVFGCAIISRRRYSVLIVLIRFPGHPFRLLSGGIKIFALIRGSRGGLLMHARAEVALFCRRQTAFVSGEEGIFSCAWWSAVLVGVWEKWIRDG